MSGGDSTRKSASMVVAAPGGNRSRQVVVAELHPNDILVGRGAPFNNYVGNIRFRALIATRKAEYNQAARHRLKNHIARQVMHVIAQRGGRFLRRIESPEEANELNVASGNGGWVLACEGVALEKVKQALRNKEGSALPTEEELLLAQQETAAAASAACLSFPSVGGHFALGSSGNSSTANGFFTPSQQPSSSSRPDALAALLQQRINQRQVHSSVSRQQLDQQYLSMLGLQQQQQQQQQQVQRLSTPSLNVGMRPNVLGVNSFATTGTSTRSFGAAASASRQLLNSTGVMQGLELARAAASVQEQQRRAAAAAAAIGDQHRTMDMLRSLHATSSTVPRQPTGTTALTGLGSNGPSPAESRFLELLRLGAAASNAGLGPLLDQMSRGDAKASLESSIPRLVALSSNETSPSSSVRETANRKRKAMSSSSNNDSSSLSSNDDTSNGKRPNQAVV